MRLPAEVNWLPQRRTNDNNAFVEVLLLDEISMNARTTVPIKITGFNFLILEILRFSKYFITEVILNVSLKYYNKYLKKSENMRCYSLYKHCISTPINDR